MIDLATVGTSGVTALLHVLQQCAYRCFRLIRHGTVEWDRNATEQTFQKASVALNFSLMAYSGVYRKGFCLQGSYLLIGSNRASYQYDFMFTHAVAGLKEIMGTRWPQSGPSGNTRHTVLRHGLAASPFAGGPIKSSTIVPRGHDCVMVRPYFNSPIRAHHHDRWIDTSKTDAIAVEICDGTQGRTPRSGTAVIIYCSCFISFHRGNACQECQWLRLPHALCMH